MGDHLILTVGIRVIKNPDLSMSGVAFTFTPSLFVSIEHLLYIGPYKVEYQI